MFHRRKWVWDQPWSWSWRRRDCTSERRALRTGHLFSVAVRVWAAGRSWVHTGGPGTARDHKDLSDGCGRGP